MRRFLQYLLLTSAFLMLSSGVVVATFMDTYDIFGYDMLWMILPTAAMFMAAVVVNDKLLIPRLLLRGRFVAYCVYAPVLSCCVTLILLGMEYWVRKIAGIPFRISDYQSPWILVDVVCESMLLALVLLGLGLWQLYKRRNIALRREKKMSDSLRDYISTVNHRLNPDHIFSCLAMISRTMKEDAEKAVAQVHDLSAYLRRQLYEMPSPPTIASIDSEEDRFSRITSFLVARRYRVLRHSLFLLVVFIIACGTFFNAPDNPEFTLERLVSVIAMWGVMVFLAYINIAWLYRRFKRRLQFRRYVVEVLLLILAIVAPLIVLQIMTYEPTVYSKQLPLSIALISTSGTVVTLFFYVGGVSAVLMLQNWIVRRQRMTLLRAETVKQEYSYLRKQINPHFLFNVLNNIGITILDDPELSASILSNLTELLRYQLDRMDKESATIGEETEFIRSYMDLEKSRRDNFDCRLVADESLRNQRVPTLLFIPFVENAAKYAATARGRRTVEMSLIRQGTHLQFECGNPYDASRAASLNHGGIGLDNTRRRLALLFSDNYTLTHEDTGSYYKVSLTIPLDYEMYNC